MCGIAGIFAFRAASAPVNAGELHRIREAMANRGPDGAGTWISSDGRIGLAHRRLAIIDLSDTGAQPMHSADGRLAIVFNGEIYNYQDLKRGLEAKGHVFRSTSDTEVILALYREKGAALVDDLLGMFAFALWDADRQGLLLARDPFGIKPLYVADDGKTLRFASQVKALLAGGAVDATPDPAGHAGFYLWGSVPEPHTLYRGIQALPAGSTQWIDHSAAQAPLSYFDLNSEFRAAEETPMSLSSGELQEYLRTALMDSVKHHLVSDVPVGIFLSAGRDSSTLTACAQAQGNHDLRTLTLGFREFAGTPQDETQLAEHVAAHYGTRHETHWVARSDFLAHLEAALAAMDQPSIDGINTYFVSKAASEAGIKVALSGVGGDELFGGYPSFRQVPLLSKALASMRLMPGLGRGLRKVRYPFKGEEGSAKLLGILEYGGTVAGAYLLRRSLFMPWELPGLVGEEMARDGLAKLQTMVRLGATIHGLKRDRTRISALELSWYMRNQLLRDADWAGLAHGVEIRTPLVDVGLFRALAPLLAGPSPPRKQDMAAVATPALPTEILNRPKTGFGTPVQTWAQDPDITGTLRRGLRPWSMRVGGLLEGKPGFSTGQGRRRILVLVTDAFGGHGGISQFNQDLLSALCSHPDMSEVVAIPRLLPKPPGRLPSRLRQVVTGLGHKTSYLFATLREVWENPNFDLLICGHINLLPLAWFLKIWCRAPLALVIHGVDAWTPTRNPISNLLARSPDAVLPVSRVTAQRFQAWSKVESGRLLLLQNAVHLDHYAFSPKPTNLLERYGLHDHTVLVTLGRMASLERYKGFDEVLDALPTLIKEFPSLRYLAIGDGSDHDRLVAKVEKLGLHGHVIFPGLISESEKADHYRLADAYVMPSRGEGFGRVFLEAMACGVPVVASKVDGSREAVLQGDLGQMVDPADPEDILRGIRAALATPKGIPEGLEQFAFPRFVERCHALVDDLCQMAG